jgi:hypothetical protein
MSISKKFFLSFAILILAVSAMLTQSCRKESFRDNGALEFSTDTLSFDTVFTQLASTTRFFKIYNKESKAVKISSIRLLDLQTDAPFRMNVDGVVGKQFSDVEIPAKDSIYVFVEVTVKNPQNPNNPFVIADAIEFVTNGVAQNVVLEVWGQDAYYHKGEIYATGQTVTWTNDKPHIILASSFPGVGVDEGATLNIQSGCKIFAGNNSGLFVYGTLNAQANSWSDSIVFRGLRLESFYRDKPAQWWGIIYGRNTSLIAQLNLQRVVVNETFFGIADEYIFNLAFQQMVFPNSLLKNYSSATASKLNLTQCIVKNAQNTALFALNAEVNAVNCLFHTTGSNVAALALGGVYNLNHCTIYNTGGKYLQHKQEALLIADKIVAIEDNGLYAGVLNTQIANTVVWGSLDNEFRFTDDADAIRFDHCLLKFKQDSATKYASKFIDCKFNDQPKFKDVGKEDFTPSDSLGSPLIDVGILGSVPSANSVDLFDRARSSVPDIGALEGK